MSLVFVAQESMLGNRRRLKKCGQNLANHFRLVLKNKRVRSPTTATGV